MKHFKYSIFRAIYSNPDISYLKQFFSANIKTLYTYPKSIWYSLRLNHGEKFMLHNTNIYPYNYNFLQDNNVDTDPINRANKLNANLTEFEILNYLISNKVNDQYFTNRMPAILSNVKLETESTYAELIRIVNLVEGKDLNLPVYIYSQIMYGFNVNFKHKFNEKLDVTDKNKLIEKFIEKIEYASAEGVVNAMGYLVNTKNYNAEIWNKLVESLENKEFSPEFTKVCNKTPFLFRYQEVEDKSIKQAFLDDFSNEMFLLGNYLINYI